MIESSADQPCRMIHRFQYVTKDDSLGEAAVRIIRVTWSKDDWSFALPLCNDVGFYNSSILLV
jgi:hypothetical protein